MSFQKKYYISLCLLILGFLSALTGFKNIYSNFSADGFFGVGLLYGGVAVGLASGVFWMYYRGRRTENMSQDRVEIETLAKNDQNKPKP